MYSNDAWSSLGGILKENFFSLVILYGLMLYLLISLRAPLVCSRTERWEFGYVVDHSVPLVLNRFVGPTSQKKAASFQAFVSTEHGLLQQRKSFFYSSRFEPQTRFDFAF
uniref:Uncharacterized protein n=1 Tax=Arundo donax TaxID=35708 RepID=A0A0A9GGH4_ARUDO